MADYNEPYLTLTLKGINRDQNPSSLPENVWSGGQNIRFTIRGVEKFQGFRSVLDPTFAAAFGIPVTYVDAKLWVYVGHDGIGVTDFTQDYDITVSGGIGEHDQWNGTLINNLVVLNNQEQYPLWWDGNTSNAMTILPNWPYGQTARVIRSYKSYLLAMDITIDFGGGNVANYNTMLHWSDAAPSGSVPDSWDETDTTRDAGKVELSDTPGALLDGQPIGDSFVIYKRNSCYIAQYDGSQLIFRFRKLYDKLGVLATGCVLPFDGKHIVLSADDLVVHDGSGAPPVSVIDGRMREWLFGALNMTQYERTFLAHNPHFNEIWVCFPQGSSEYCDTALIWNYTLNTFAARDLPQCTYGASGIVDATSTDDWASDDEPWSSDIYTWNQWSFNSSRESLLFFSPLHPQFGSQLFEMDRTDADYGSAPHVEVYRESMPLLDRRNIKLVKAVYPLMSSTGESSTVQISVGSQMNPKDPISWSAKQDFIIGTTEKIDVLVKGRYISIKFESDTEINWVLHAFDFEIENAERY